MPSEIDKKIGSELRRIRQARGLSQEQLAAGLQVLGLDIDNIMISRIENGSRRITYCEFVRTWQLLSFDIDEFCEQIV